MAKTKGKDKDKGGRPTLFKPEYAELLIKFFDIEPYRKLLTEKSTEYFANGEIKKEAEKYTFKPNKLPTLLGFSKKIGVVYSTVWRWAEKGEDLDEKGEWKEGIAPDFVRFCNAYKEAKEVQKEFLISLGLAGVTPPAAFIFVAKNVTNMRDKIEVGMSALSEDDLKEFK